MRKLVWLLAVLAFVNSSCRHMWGKKVRGDGNVKTEEHTVSNFKNVDVSGAIKVYVSQGDLQPVKIEADQNLLQYIEVVQEGNEVFVSEKSGYNLEPTGEIRVYVTSPVYNRIKVSGASDIIGQTKINNSENLELEATGAGDINMEVDAPKLAATITGSGSINLKGQTKDVELELSGAGHAHCYDLMAENTTVDISGAGSAEVYASVKLDATVSGAGSVSYKGNASNVSQHVSGVGSVNKVN
ncbi:MAG TPA: head GIN domain-containing protein [Puia sp.]|nr:head GIN domain-containing protein [Puia sp.]